MYSEFYVRLGSYEYDAEDLSNKVHLTNNSVQKKTENYNKHDFCSHAMWDYVTLKAYVAELQGGDEEAAENTWTSMMHQVEKIVINSLKAMCDVCEGRDKSFELYGYDFMIDNTYRPWLIEVTSCKNDHCVLHCCFCFNSQPMLLSTACSTPLTPVPFCCSVRRI